MNETKDFSAPLGSASAGTLEFAGGAANLTIRSGAEEMDELFRARFRGTAPEVEVEDGKVTFHYPRRFSLKDIVGQQSGEISLNPTISWGVFIAGGLAELDGELGGIRLESFEVEGGASRLDLALSEPSEVVRISIGGGASDLSISRPEGVAASVLAGSGVSRLTLDDQSLGAVGGETRLQSSGYADAPNRYDISIKGGASSIAVSTR